MTNIIQFPEIGFVERVLRRVRQKTGINPLYRAGEALALSRHGKEVGTVIRTEICYETRTITYVLRSRHGTEFRASEWEVELYRPILKRLIDMVTS